MVIQCEPFFLHFLSTRVAMDGDKGYVWCVGVVVVLCPAPCTPLIDKQSGELSRISWAYSPKVVSSNEIARLAIIT